MASITATSRLASVVALTIGFGLLTGSRSLAQDAAQSATPAPPAETTADILALLDQEKPDPEQAAELAAKADAEIDATLADPQRGEALFHRGQARAVAGRLKDAITDMQEAINLSKGQNYYSVTSRYQQFLHKLLMRSGDDKQAVPIIKTEIRNLSFPRTQGRLFSLYSELSTAYLLDDNLDSVEQLDRNIHALLAASRSWPAQWDPFRPVYQAEVEQLDGPLLEARGRYAEAETVYRRGAQVMADALDHYDEAFKIEGENFPPREEFERFIEAFQIEEGRMKVEQGRAFEGEVDIREALINRLHRLGKYHEETGIAVGGLAMAVMAQGRHEDAERLTRAALDIYRSVGLQGDAPRIIVNLQRLEVLLDGGNQPAEAQAIADEVERLVAGWPATRREAVVNELPRIKQLIATGKATEAVELATRKLERARARSGDASQITAVVRGYLASALAKAGRGGEAVAAFKAAIPVLLESARQEQNDDSLTEGGIANRNRYILENYLDLLAHDPSLAGANAAEETVGLADKLRGHAVQRALAQASARSAAKDPALGGLARTEQDLSKQLNDATADLANLLAQPPEQRADKAVKDLQAKVTKLRAAHAAAERDLAKKFPAYANLIDPPPLKAADIRAVLRDDEVMLSFYFGDNGSFAWAISKRGPTLFRALPITRDELEQKVGKLREALAPEAATIADIPAFDVALAHSLYAALLEPVADVWRPAKNLIVATNGALGFLPLGLLPTAAAQPAPDASLPFAEYRGVPWLARDHAITMIPSASALKALRTTVLADNQRQKLIGFGDPYFSVAQANEAAQQAQVAAAGTLPAEQGAAPELASAPADVTRGAPLALRHDLPPGIFDISLNGLPRLPDTADELRAMAASLGVDPVKALKLGKDANERVVKSAKLSDYRVVAFATHGLMADDIDGLDQPALALTSPRVAGIMGKGLLTMEDVIALKLNADWVILSACNTGSGAGEGAEAASGLGRAFYYAGARALLVTNWSVHSQSARDLITELFRRQAADARLSRSEALRQSMLALADGPGFVDESGKTLFSYAHPLFWAPYSVLGDGGGS